MRRRIARPLPALLFALAALCCSSCQGGKRFYPVHGQVLVNGKPTEGVTVVFHPLDDPDPQPTQPSAISAADGTFVLKSYLVHDRTLKEGAPPGRYHVTCVWYPPNLQDYLGRENLPDKLNGKYADPKTSGLQADVGEGPTEVPPLKLEAAKK